MKKLVKVALVAVCMVFVGNFAKAQQKIGYISFELAVQSLPELKTAQKQITDYQKTWTDQLQALQSELQTKSQQYQAQQATMTDAVRTAKQSELQDLNKRLQDQSQLAQQQVEAKGNEFTKPLIDKVKAAVVAVAKEKGYGYVLNSSSTDLVVSPEADDLLPAVKLKLGVK
jgi:outer membrane protein